MHDILKDYIDGQLRDLGEDADVQHDDDLVLLGFDSIAYVRLLAFIDDRFGIQVPDSEVTVERFGTIDAMVGYLGERRAGESERSV
jgi:acyl carrier protein